MNYNLKGLSVDHLTELKKRLLINLHETESLKLTVTIKEPFLIRFFKGRSLDLTETISANVNLLEHLFAERMEAKKRFLKNRIVEIEREIKNQKTK